MSLCPACGQHGEMVYTVTYRTTNTFDVIDDEQDRPCYDASESDLYSLCPDQGSIEEETFSCIICAAEWPALPNPDGDDRTYPDFDNPIRP